MYVHVVKEKACVSFVPGRIDWVKHDRLQTSVTRLGYDISIPVVLYIQGRKTTKKFGFEHRSINKAGRTDHFVYLSEDKEQTLIILNDVKDK